MNSLLDEGPGSNKSDTFMQYAIFNSIPNVALRTEQVHIVNALWVDAQMRTVYVHMLISIIESISYHTLIFIAMLAWGL